MRMVFLGVTKRTYEDYIVKGKNDLCHMKIDKLGISRLTSVFPGCLSG